MVYYSGFKAVRCIEAENRLLSWSPPVPQVTQEYYIGQATRRKIDCGPLAVLRSLNDVNAMLQGIVIEDTDVVFSCIYKRSNLHGLFYYDANGYRRWATKYLPIGTDFADEVVLLKPIYTRRRIDDGKFEV